MCIFDFADVEKLAIFFWETIKGLFVDNKSPYGHEISTCLGVTPHVQYVAACTLLMDQRVP